MDHSKRKECDSKLPVNKKTQSEVRHKRAASIAAKQHAALVQYVLMGI